MEKIISNLKNIRLKIMLNETVRLVIRQFIAFIGGFIFSLARFFGGISPIFVAFTAVVPAKYSIAAVFGGSLGCLATASTVNAVQSIAAAAAAATINCTVYRLLINRRVEIIAPISAAVCTAVTGITALSAGGFSVNGVITYTGASILAGCAAYFIGGAVHIHPLPSGNFCLGAKELASLAITGCAIFLSLGTLEIRSIVPARALAVIVILLFSRHARETGGTIAGVCSGVALSLATGHEATAGVFALAGLLSGVFASLGAIASATVFTIICGLAILILGDSADIATFVEAVFGAVIFLLIPARSADSLKRIFITSKNKVPVESARSAVIVKLRGASDTISKISGYIGAVSSSFNSLNASPVDLVPESVKINVCSDCAMNTECHVKNEKFTKTVFDGIMEDLAANKIIYPERLNSRFSQDCIKVYELSEEFNKAYSRHIAYKESREKASQIREVITDQFDCIADILEEVSDEISQAGKYSARLARKASNAIEACGINVKAASCCTDKNGHIRLTVQSSAFSDPISPLRISKAVSRACEIKFSEPAIVSCGDGVMITMTQVPVYELTVGVAQSCSGTGNYCGDCCNYFNDGRGRSIMVLSDGMGTGSRAAVDASLTCEIFSRTVRAGIGFESSVKLVNSALLVKGEYESLATLDVLSMDLFSGKTEFYKAGGTTTLIRKGDKIFNLEMPALPVGILRNARLEKTSAPLDVGDVILMFSDGLEMSDGKWIEQELKQFRGESPAEFAQRLVSLSRKQTSGVHKDDVTVMCGVVHYSKQ
ncbi:MAG: serine/threonine-protein phosphatase [Clostridiales bacterium]|nr:serine/threonine-protein phosphatase [Clostridiales bacterium]